MSGTERAEHHDWSTLSRREAGEKEKVDPTRRQEVVSRGKVRNFEESKRRGAFLITGVRYHLR